MPRLPSRSDDESVDEPIAVPKQYQHSYDQVKAVIQDIKAKELSCLAERHVYNISYGDWLELRSEFRLDTHYFPPYEYDTSRSVLTFLEMKPPVYHSVVDFLSRCFVLKTSWKDPIEVTRGGQTLREREYNGSEKAPSLAIRESSIEGIIKWVLEVGFSEDEDKLQHDMRLWLRGNSKIIQCVLVKIVEDPEYKCPLSKHMTDEEIEGQGLREQVKAGDFTSGSTYGPLFYKKHQWVGNIREIYMEVWKLNATTSEPEQVGTRRAIHPIPTDRPIQLDDILPNSIVSEMRGGSGSLSIDWDEFAESLEHSIYRMARLRYHRWWYACAKAREENQKEDPNYVEEGEESSGEDRKKTRTKRRKLN
jgi:hypothetical protein